MEWPVINEASFYSFTGTSLQFLSSRLRLICNISEVKVTSTVYIAGLKLSQSILVTLYTCVHSNIVFQAGLHRAAGRRSGLLRMRN